jgi:hypothetical protein
MNFEFRPYPKTPRFHKPVVITEKIDGTNAAVVVAPYLEDWSPYDAQIQAAPGVEFGPGVIVIDPADGKLVVVYAQSRKRVIQPGKQTDNYGFAQWVREHASELVLLGKGVHYGEWYGQGIQHGYGMDHRRFALFNPDAQDLPDCVDVVPVLTRGQASELNYRIGLMHLVLENNGSFAPGAALGSKAEGMIIYHTGSRQVYKVLLEGDDTPKGARA